MQRTHTPVPAADTLERLAEYVSVFEPSFRYSQFRWASLYLRGLLLDGERKSIEPMMERLELPADFESRDPLQAMRHCVGHGRWEAERVLALLRTHVCPALDAPDAALILDDTPIPKQGTDSVGVARQYNSTIGASRNCQVAVTVHYASARGHCPIAGRLYLPTSWTSDPDRLTKAKVPSEYQQPKTKIQIALELLDEAIADVGKKLVLADAWYGDSFEFRAELERRGLQYAVGTKSATGAFTVEPRWIYPDRKPGRGRPPFRPRLAAGCPPPITLSEIAATVRFRRCAWREGTKGKLHGQFARLRVWPAHGWTDGMCATAKSLWLLIEEHHGEFKYYFSNLPESVSLVALVRAVKSRWPIEQGYQQMKEELGLDHFEGRRWPGFHHHLSLVFVAFGFLELERQRLGAITKATRKKA